MGYMDNSSSQQSSNTRRSRHLSFAPSVSDRGSRCKYDLRQSCNTLLCYCGLVPRFVFEQKFMELIKHPKFQFVLNKERQHVVYGQS